MNPLFWLPEDGNNAARIDPSKRKNWWSLSETIAPHVTTLARGTLWIKSPLKRHAIYGC